MNEISHYIDEEGKVVIDATIDNNTYRGVLVPKTIGGKAYLKKSDINTDGFDNKKDIQDQIASYVSTHRGKYKENPLVIEDDLLENYNSK